MLVVPKFWLRLSCSHMQKKRSREFYNYHFALHQVLNKPKSGQQLAAKFSVPSACGFLALSGVKLPKQNRLPSIIL